MGVGVGGLDHQGSNCSSKEIKRPSNVAAWLRVELDAVIKNRFMTWSKATKVPRII
jgi:hypothetical protein